MFERINKEFSKLAGVKVMQPGRNYSCVHFGIHNIALANLLGYDARVLWVNTVGKDRKRHEHAYLFDNLSDVRSIGWTWPNNFFNELSLNEARSLEGKDITTILLQKALMFSHDYSQVLKNLEENIPGIIKEVRQFHGL